VTAGNPSGVITRGRTIGAQTLHDLTFLYSGPAMTKFTLQIANLWDAHPPFARTDLNYDALTADPLGRTIKFGVSKKIY
jgi:iron complex outermembrane receptor protein